MRLVRLSLVLSIPMSVAMSSTGCGHRPPVVNPAGVACELPTPETVHRDGAAIVERWALEHAEDWMRGAPSVGPATTRFRRALTARTAGGLAPEAIFAGQIARYAGSADPMEQGEVANAKAVRDHKVGRVRDMSCLEAALFERQTARYPEEIQPTELQAFVLGRAGRLVVYAIGSDQPYPPKATHAMPHIERELADGWTLFAHFHNHTFERTGSRHAALGTLAPSTSDVHYLRGLGDLHLARVFVSNGFHSVELTAAELMSLASR